MIVWPQIQLRHLFDIYSGSTPESGKGFYWDGDIPWVTPEDISHLETGYRLYDTRRKITDEGYEKSGVTLVPENSIVLTKRAPIGLLAILGIKACSNQGCFLLVSKKEISPEFYYYYLYATKTKLQILGRGSTFMELSLDDIKSFKVPFPPPEAQNIIANFLSKEIANLDNLVNAKEAQLRLLTEKRLTLISHAITKGLNANIKYKDSAIDWLGKIPVHWELKKIKYIADLKSGDFITSDTIKESDLYPVYGGNGLRGYTNKKNRSGEFVLIGRQGALCGNINYANGDFYASEHAIVCKPIVKYELTWLGELLRIMNLNQYSVSAAQPGLSVEVIKNLLVPVPKIKEQEQISQFIFKETEKIDMLTQATQKSIDLLKERRTALITEVVTGQLEIT